MPAVVPSTLNGTFTVFAPTEVALLLEAIKSPARVSNWLKTRMFRHLHVRFHAHKHAHTLFIKLLRHIAGWLPTETPSAQQTDSTCLQLIDFNCHIWCMSSGRHKLCVSLCVGHVYIFVYSFLPDEINWACLPVPAQPFGEQSTQSPDGLPWREAISCMLNGPSEDANISLISHCSHLNEQHHNLHTEWSEML